VTEPEEAGLGVPGYRLSQLVRYFLYLGTAGFGGPVALVEYMHRDLVERRGWISEDEYREGLALANLSPGPLAAQLAIYLGFVHYRFLGATVVSAAFISPSFLMVITVGWAYLRFGGLPWMQAVFYGVGAAIIGIIAWSAYRLTRKTIARDPLLWVIFATMAAITAITETERIELFPLAGLAVWAARSPRFRRRTGTAMPFLIPFPVLWQTSGGSSPGLSDIFWFFFKAGAFVFGSGLAIVPFLYGGVVKGFGWLDAQQFLDAVAVAMITPGPVVITTGFIGYLVADLPGAAVAVVATFLPPTCSPSSPPPTSANTAADPHSPPSSTGSPPPPSAPSPEPSSSSAAEPSSTSPPPSSPSPPSSSSGRAPGASPNPSSWPQPQSPDSYSTPSSPADGSLAAGDRGRVALQSLARLPPCNYEPDRAGVADQAKRAKCLLRAGFCFASFRVLDRPIAPSRAMDARWMPQRLSL